MSPARSTLTLAERIAARTVVGIERKPGLGPCWEWDGAHSNGYASIGLRNPRRSARVHRLVFEIEHGPIRAGMHIDHRCHNHGCIRVDHLRELTPAQNNEHRAGTTRASTVGVRGVSKRNGFYFARATLHGVTYYGGNFARLEDAERAAIALRRQIGMTE